MQACCGDHCSRSTSAAGGRAATAPTTAATAPKRYLSISTPDQRPQIDYVPNDAFIKVAEYLDNYRNVREALNEICAINTELLRRREELD